MGTWLDLSEATLQRDVLLSPWSHSHCAPAQGENGERSRTTRGSGRLPAHPYGRWSRFDLDHRPAWRDAATPLVSPSPLDRAPARRLRCAAGTNPPLSGGSGSSARTSTRIGTPWWGRPDVGAAPAFCAARPCRPSPPAGRPDRHFRVASRPGHRRSPRRPPCSL